jgi:redox-sensitive bicupin YhaK (pirin superfamily)
VIKLRKRAEHGNINHGWLNTYHHFSFANFFDPKKMGFGPLRVLNDDYITGKTGFDMHPHKDMEIVTYVIDGSLTHQDSLNNERKVSRGHVQYMSAGTGIFHSEHNKEDETLRLLQIWILPRLLGGLPNYGDFLFNEEDRLDKWLHFVGQNTDVKLNQDVNFYVTETNKKFEFKVNKGRQVYLVNIEGNTKVNNQFLEEGDAVMANEDLFFIPEETSHVLLIEMKTD